MWLSRLAYLADIFCPRSELSESLEVFHTSPRQNKSFQEKLGSIIKEVESGKMSSLPF
jgi:hypothetical protein